MSQSNRVESNLGSYKKIQEFKMNVPTKDNYTSLHTTTYVTLIITLELF